MINETKPPTPMRPRRRTVLKSIAAIVLVFLVYRVIWWATGSPAPKVDYLAKAQELAASYQPAKGENGWPLIVEAAEMLEAIKSEDDIAGMLKKRSSEFSQAGGYALPENLDFKLLLQEPISNDPDQPEIVALRKLRDQKVFQLVQRAGAMPRMVRTVQCSTPESRSIVDMVLPNVGNIQNISQACLVSMRRASQEGTAAEQIGSFDNALIMGQVCARQFSFIDRLVAQNIAESALNELMQEIQESPVDLKTLNQFERVMEQRFDWPPTALLLNGERLWLLGLVQRCFSDNGHGDGRIIAERVNEFITGYSEGTATQIIHGTVDEWVHEGRRKTTTRINEFYDGMVQMSQLSLQERQSSLFSVDHNIQSLPPWQKFLRFVFPTVGRALTLDDERIACIRATRILIALKKYELRHGNLPETLDDLVPEFMDQPLIDPINDQPFIYRRVENNEGQNRIVLYSMGTDGKDDSAEADFSDLDAVITFGENIWEEGTDMLFTKPRPKNTLIKLNQADAEK